MFQSIFHIYVILIKVRKVRKSCQMRWCHEMVQRPKDVKHYLNLQIIQFWYNVTMYNGASLDQIKISLGGVDLLSFLLHKILLLFLLLLFLRTELARSFSTTLWIIAVNGDGVGVEILVKLPPLNKSAKNKD